MMKHLLLLLRPHQWLKNLLLLFPPFLDGSLFQVGSFFEISLPLICFSAGASSIYVVNDLFDVKQDLRHPQKSRRPLPSGNVSKSLAVCVAFSLSIGSLLGGFWVSPSFLVYLIIYLIISVAYSWYLKQVAILELFCVVSGFVLRLFAGGEAFDVIISDWLFLSVFLLALYLVCGKRLSELRHESGCDPADIRPVLESYPAGFLEGAMFVSGASVLVTYTMYVLIHPNLVYTVPLCCFGLLSYLLRVLSGKGGDPTRALLNDPLLCAVGLLWLILTGLSIYGALG